MSYAYDYASLSYFPLFTCLGLLPAKTRLKFKQLEVIFEIYLLDGVQFIQP